MSHREYTVKFCSHQIPSVVLEEAERVAIKRHQNLAARGIKASINHMLNVSLADVIIASLEESDGSK